MSSPTRREHEELRREVFRLKQQLAQRPLIITPGAGDNRTYQLQIIGGNTLSDGSTLGVEWVTPAPTEVPSAYDPTVTTSFIDGVGRAYLLVDNVSEGIVLVAHYDGLGNGLNLAIFAGDVISTSAATVSLPVTGGGGASVSLYVPYSL